MKKVFKKLSCGLLAVCLLMLITVTAFAKDETDSCGLTGPTDLFIDVCDDLFAENSNCKAIDKNGVDVTEKFLNEHRLEYLSGNYFAIWIAVRDDLSAISWENGVPEPQLLMSKTASDSFYVLDKTTENMPGKAFEMMYTISGSYKYHDSNGQISECSDTVLNINSFDAGAQFTYELFDISTNATIAGDNKSVKFSAKFSLALSYNSSKLPLILWTEDFGPYSNSVTGYTY